MAGKKAGEKGEGKNEGREGGPEKKYASMKTWMPWLPFVSWIIGAVVITCLLFVFYNPSPTISAAYFVIVAVGFYILWRSRRSGWGKKGKK